MNRCDRVGATHERSRVGTQFDREIERPHPAVGVDAVHLRGVIATGNPSGTANRSLNVPSGATCTLPKRRGSENNHATAVLFGRRPLPTTEIDSRA